MEKISWTDSVRNEVLCRVKKQRNILHTTKERKENWIGYTLRSNYIARHITEGRTEGETEVMVIR